MTKYNHTIVTLNDNWSELHIETFDKPILIRNDLVRSEYFIRRAFKQAVCSSIQNRKHIDLHPVGDESLPYVEMDSLLWHYASWSNDSALSTDRLREALDYAEKNL